MSLQKITGVPFYYRNDRALDRTSTDTILRFISVLIRTIADGNDT